MSDCDVFITGRESHHSPCSRNKMYKYPLLPLWHILGNSKEQNERQQPPPPLKHCHWGNCNTRPSELLTYKIGSRFN